MSWIPSGSLSGWPTYGIGEDTVTPRDTDSTVSLEWAKKKANEYREIRFYNYLHAWIEVEQSGKIVKYDFYEDSDGENNEEWLGAGSVAYDTIRDKKYFAATKDKPECVAFRQIVGGRTSRPELTAIIGALLGLSIYLPVIYIFTYGLGCLANMAIGKIKGRAWAEEWGVPLCAGLIVGEAMLALVINAIVLIRG